MSWIFTIVFSGILFSSNAGTEALPKVEPMMAEQPSNFAKQDETDRFEQTYPLNPNGRVSVSNVNGSIVAEAWDRNEVKLIAIKTADTKERLDEVEIKVDSKPDSFSVESNYNNWKQKNGESWRNGGRLVVEFQLMIPRGAVLNEVETVNGSVTVSNFANVTKVSAVNGTVRASNLRGTADLSTVNGEVIADFTALDPGSKISLGTVNGKVNLTIPSDSNATLKVDSLNGNITNDFGLPVRKGKYVGRDLYGKIGSGDVRIKIESVNGELKILRQNDGKSLNPATNLLPNKEKDDEDWDSMFGNEIDREMANADREMAKVSRASATAAMKEAQKEMERIKPELARITADSAKIAAEAMRSEKVQNAIRDGMRQTGEFAKLAEIGFFPGVSRVEKKSQSFPVKGVPKITVNGRGCDVKVTGWDKNEVQYSVSQRSDQRNKKPLNISEKREDSSLVLTVENPDAGNRSGEFFGPSVQTRIEIFVPRKSVLKIKTDGQIRMEGVSGDVELIGEDEAINVRDVNGTLRVSNTDGRVRIIGFRGELTSTTVDGNISLEGEFDKLTANGNLGSITVTMPGTAGALISADSPNVMVDGLDLVQVVNDPGSREYKIGSGTAIIKVTTGGNITFRNSNRLTSGS